MISTEPPTAPSDGEQSGQERPIHRGIDMNSDRIRRVVDAARFLGAFPSPRAYELLCEAMGLGARR
jgi:hypothetical protein